MLRFNEDDKMGLAALREMVNAMVCLGWTPAELAAFIGAMEARDVARSHNQGLGTGAVGVTESDVLKGLQMAPEWNGLRYANARAVLKWLP